MTRTILRPLGLFMLFALSASAGLAQIRNATEPAEIRGQIRYPNGTPAFNVIVRLEKVSGGYEGELSTDRLGRFRFTRLSPIQYRLNIREPGYREIDREVNLVMQSSDYVQLQLVPDGSANAGRTPGRLGVVDASVPPEAQSEFEKGRAAVQGGKRPDESLPHLEKAVQLYPNFLEAQFLLGMVYMDEHRWEQAEAALRQVLRVNAKVVPAYIALGEAYRRQKKYKEAERELVAGLKLDDKSVQGHFTLGRVYYEVGDIQKAGPQVGTALRLDPKLAEGHLLAGNILLKAKQAENALAEFQAYLVLAPAGEFAPQARDMVAKIKQALASKKP